ncbi:MAG TPA: FtsX-like permease family protein, partial [Casimicrobiaceae bacterium]|nr:FtsX-like permease family protein [Casimicrobiaceae bacterium]
FGANLAPSMGAATPEAIRAAHRQLHDAIASTPGVAAAAISWGALPMSGDDEALFWREGQPRPASPDDMLWTLRYVVEPEYFAAMRIPLVRGRFLSLRDDEHAPRVAAVDEEFARKFFGDGDPIGRRINVELYDTPVQIVGIVRHVNQWGLDADAAQPVRAQLYLPFMQLPDPAMRQTASGVSVVVRRDGTNPDALGAIGRSIARVNAEQVIYDVRSLDQVVAASVASRRFAMLVLAAFAIQALALAALGIYGVLAHVVRQRTHELGVRMALGARPRDLTRIVLSRALTLVGTGIGIGLAMSAGVTRLMGDLLFGISPVDPGTFTAVALLLLVVALLACAIPTYRATHADSLAALRVE